jgi:hypothetical protein
VKLFDKSGGFVFGKLKVLHNPDIGSRSLVAKAANLMLKRYGDLAEAESARPADELWEVGDAAGVAVWRLVMGAVRQLVNVTPPGPVH